MHTAIFHGVNSSLFFFQETGTLVDGLHRGKEVHFSLMPPEELHQLEQHSGIFGHLDNILFTHLHIDHYDRRLLEQAADIIPRPLIYGPELELTNTAVQPLGDGLYQVPLRGAVLYAKNTVHDGAEFARDPHQSLLLEIGEERFFIAGDAKFLPQEAELFLKLSGGNITAGFFNLYQFWSPESVAFMQALAPERLFLNHMPVKEDDPFGYHRLSRQIIRRLPPELGRPELLENMAWVDGRAPKLV